MLFRQCHYDNYFTIPFLVFMLFTLELSPSSAHFVNTTSQLRGASFSSSSSSSSVEHSFSLSCGSHRSSIDDEDADLMEYIHSRHERKLANQQVTIPVCFHILTNDKGVNSLSMEQIQAQMNVLNRAYSSASCCDTTKQSCPSQSCSEETGFRFAWSQLNTTTQHIIPDATVPQNTDEGACIITHYIPRWTQFISFWDPRLRHMKKKLRKGDATTLNVYWIDFLTMKTAGYSTFPHSYWRKPRLDGIVMRVGVSVGGSITPYSQGAMLAHEVGHWLGLYHTFEQGCDARSDRIDDTPREAAAFRGCGQIEDFPLNRDSCPNDKGSDPIHNFMDYAYDVCKFEFTQGQVQRMQASYERYRMGK